MQTIYPQQFFGYTQAGICNYLALQGQTDWCIRIPRQCRVPVDPDADIVHEYCVAVYLGEELAKRSPFFSYKAPSMYSLHGFEFIIQKPGLQQLAAALYLLLAGSAADDTGDAPADAKLAWEHQERFWQQVSTGEIEPVCIGITAWLDFETSG